MWYKTLHVISIFVLFAFPSAKGSCLEYGHSCWGAHGKRSGSAVFANAAERSTDQNPTDAVFSDAGRGVYLPKVERENIEGVEPMKQYQPTRFSSLLRKRPSNRKQINNLADADIAAFEKLRLKNFAQPEREKSTHARELYPRIGERNPIRKDTESSYFDYK